MIEIDFNTKRTIANKMGVEINSEHEEIEVMKGVSNRLLARYNRMFQRHQRNPYLSTIYANHYYCHNCIMILLNGTECTGCYHRKYWESMTAYILKWFNKGLYSWFYIPQFQHIELKSGRGRNDYMPFDFAGIDLDPIKIVHRKTIPDWCLEVNEEGHFGKGMFHMKPSDYLKWDFCLRHRIPLLYVNLSDSPNDRVDQMVNTLELIMNRVREYIDLKRSLTDKSVVDNHFIDHFCELPYKEIVLHSDFDNAPELKKTCLELISYNEAQLSEYIRRKYFQRKDANDIGFKQKAEFTGNKKII